MDNQMFQSFVQAGVQAYKDQGKPPNYYQILKSALIKQNLKWILFCGFVAFLSESFAVYYSYQVGGLIRYIKRGDDPNSTVQEGLLLVAQFVGCMLVA